MLRKILALFLVFISVRAQAVPLDSFSVFSAAHPFRPGQYVQLLARGTGTDDYYVMEVDPTTGGFPVSIVAGSLTLGYDENYGTPGATTLRTASMLGVGSTAVSNSNPVPVSDAGSSLTIDGTVAATQSGTWNINNVSGTVSLPTGAATESTLSTMNAKFTNSFGSGLGAIRTAAQIGNANGVVDYNAGNASDQTIRTVIATNQSAIPVSQSGTWNVTNISGTVSLPTGAATESTLSTLNGKHNADYGVASGAIRTAAQVGNASGVADFGSGAAGAQTLRSVLATRHESVATPLAAQLSNGSAALDYGSGASSSATLRSVLATRHESTATPLAAQLSNGSGAIDYGSGASGSATVRTVLATRHEAAATPVSVRISDGSSFSTPAAAGRSYSDSARLDYSSSNVTTGAYVQVIASTAAAFNAITVFNGCGESIYLATGGAGAESVKSIVPPGGLDGTISLAIAASTRIAVKGLSGSCTSGQFIINGYN